MNISRLSMVTLGVADLDKATRFYEEVLGTPPNTSYAGVTFIELPGAWIALFPIEELAQDIDPRLSAVRNGFNGFTLAHNVKSREEVFAVFERAKSAGARVMKAPQETSWGGLSGYFADPDGYLWEVAWGPMFEFAENGELRFKKNP